MSAETKYPSPLMRACAIGHGPGVEALLSEGADVNERGPRESTALMYAAGGGHLDIVKMLVDQKADVAATEAGGWSALDHAVEEGHVEIISLLQQVATSKRSARV